MVGLNHLFSLSLSSSTHFSNIQVVFRYFLIVKYAVLKNCTKRERTQCFFLWIRTFSFLQKWHILAHYLNVQTISVPVYICANIHTGLGVLYILLLFFNYIVEITLFSKLIFSPLVLTWNKYTFYVFKISLVFNIAFQSSYLNGLSGLLFISFTFLLIEDEHTEKVHRW